MTDLLLITDNSRLNQVFSRLEEPGKVLLRVAASLESGATEIAREKPTAVFVQNHLSGFSAEILLMHLKKQLGRKRTRFFLVAASQESTGDASRLYQGVLDSSLTDDELVAAIRTLLDKPAAPRPSRGVVAPPDAAFSDPERVTPPPQATGMTPDEKGALVSLTASVASPQSPAPLPDTPPEASLEEQGVTYAPRARLKVYSEFSGSFDEAVTTIKAIDSPAEEPLRQPVGEWEETLVEPAETAPERSKLGVFLLWCAPVVLAALVVTFLQHRSAGTPAAKPDTAVKVPAAAPPAAQSAPVTQQPQPAPARPDSAPPLPAKPAESDARMSDKAVIMAIAENRKPQPAAGTASVQTGQRPAGLPDFIPRYGYDKQYGAANPGWERYKGQVTEFKVLKDGAGIKAIQVIDRGGQGVPESFMKGVLRQLAKNSAFVQESSEKQEGYEIQRGTITGGLKVVYYRDEQGGRLRAFVVTWP